MFEGETTFEISKPYEVLDIVSTAGKMMYFDQRSANDRGVIYMMNSCESELYCFDPFGEKKITEIKAT